MESLEPRTSPVARRGSYLTHLCSRIGCCNGNPSEALQVGPNSVKHPLAPNEGLSNLCETCRRDG